MEKVGKSEKNKNIKECIKNFNIKFDQSIINNFIELEQLYQKIRDEYFNITETEHKLMTEKHAEFLKKSENLKTEIIKTSESLNKQSLIEISNLIDYANKHICKQLKIEFETHCKNCHFSLNEIIIANQNLELKYRQLDKIKDNIKYKEKEDKKDEIKKIKISYPKGEMTIKNYKNHLKNELDKMSGYDENDIVILN